MTLTISLRDAAHPGRAVVIDAAAALPMANMAGASGGAIAFTYRTTLDDAASVADAHWLQYIWNEWLLRAGGWHTATQPPRFRHRLTVNPRHPAWTADPDLTESGAGRILQWYTAPETHLVFRREPLQLTMWDRPGGASVLLEWPTILAHMRSRIHGPITEAVSRSHFRTYLYLDTTTRPRAVFRIAWSAETAVLHPEGGAGEPRAPEVSTAPQENVQTATPPRYHVDGRRTGPLPAGANDPELQAIRQVVDDYARQQARAAAVGRR